MQCEAAVIVTFVSALLFGLVHPGSKWIMANGISLLPFCVLYVGLRLVGQFLLRIKSRSCRKSSVRTIGLLVIFGIVGASLQVSEFFGISQGLPVPLVSFLVYSHPIWTILLGRVINKEKLSANAFAKLCLAVLGIALLVDAPFSNFDRSWIAYLGPLSAGLMISVWICLSRYAAQAGISATDMSFFYDLFSFLTLVLISILGESGQSIFYAISFLGSPVHFAQMVAYSFIAGLLPNILFYKGSKRTPAFVGGLILLMEPIVSTGVSWVVWNDHLSWKFLLGAGLILSINGARIFRWLWERVLVLSKEKRIAFSFFPFIIVSTFCVPARAQSSKELKVVDISPADSTNYTVNQELEQIRLAASLASKDYHKINPACSFQVSFELRRGTEEELYTFVKNLAKSPENSLIVGLSRTDFARLAAKAAQGTLLRAISVGAAASKLKEINSQFVSIAAPWERQWNAVLAELIHRGCDSSQTLALYDQRNIFSSNFKMAFESEKRGTTLEVKTLVPTEFRKRLSTKKCTFIPLNFSAAEKYLHALLASDWKGTVVGVGDWNIFNTELNKIIKQYPHSQAFFAVPTGWHPNLSQKSRKFNQLIKSSALAPASPVGAYTYDAVLIGLHCLCNKRNPAVFDSISLRKLPLLRSYEGISPEGNFLSKIQTIYPKAGH